MGVAFKSRLKGALIVTIGLIVMMTVFSLLIGWNLVTLLLFWFVIIPVSSCWLPSVISKRKGQWVESATGIAIFYAIMVFMIYSHYQSDYFKVMMVSCAVNLIVVTMVGMWRKGDRKVVVSGGQAS